LRQGDAVIPLLFNVVLEIAVRRFKVETKGTIFDKCSQIMTYADNVIIMERRLQDAKVFTSLVRQTDKMGLEINEEKTKFMIVSQKPYLENEYVKLGTLFRNSGKDYTYLGTTLTNENKLRPEVEKRLTNANRAYCALLPVLKVQ
jgi:hypothetical protein